ncbi:MAG: prephenate dehydratase [Acidimicrobiales bacterium]|nr:MAG: prephenate dehydratase [Acidimicrobiales bacterium]
MNLRYTYLGPRGTFCEQALHSVNPPGSAELSPMPTITDALEEVFNENADAALVPLDNSVEGSVRPTLDYLIGHESLMIVQEVLLPVSFSLYTRSEIDLSAISTVATHPHAEAQCRKWLKSNLPSAQVISSPSTADAAAAVSRGEYDAAICSSVAGKDYELHQLIVDVADNKDGVTRFVLVTRARRPPLPTGNDVTSLIIFISHDRAGALLEVLTQFFVRGVNLTRIESRPTKERLGRYCFFFDCEGHIEDLRLAEALKGLHRICEEVRFLGSYPKDVAGDGELKDSVLQSASGTSDRDFAMAERWIKHIRNSGPVES